MGKEYSVYDAKAKFSEIIRKVRAGQTVTVSYHGEPVAEIRPIRPQGFALEDRLRRVARRRGALQQFLIDRE